MNTITLSEQWLNEDLAKFKEINDAYKKRNRRIALTFACYVVGAAVGGYVTYKLQNN